MNCFRCGLLLPIILLASCDMTVAVSGMLGESETLSGSLTQYSDGGTIELFGGPHTHCLGNFSYRRAERTNIDGAGTLVCDDRRMGSFSFELSGIKHGRGTGTLNGESYSFTF